MPDQKLLEVRDLAVGVGKDGANSLISGLSFDISRGETLAIVGESGSGKSVTALSIMRLIEYGGGRITDGSIKFTRQTGEVVDLARQSEPVLRGLRGAEMAMIFQEPMTSLNPLLSVGDQIAEAVAQHQGKSYREARAVALAMLDLARIPSAARVMDRYPHELSGGMRQRVMIGMALCCRPSLLIADEPTTALDATIQAQILQLIRSLQRETGMAVMFITHDMGIVAQVADRVIVMNRGQQVETGTTADIFARPQQPYTRALLAAVPVLGSMWGRALPAKFHIRSDADAGAEPPFPIGQNPVVRDKIPLLRLDQLTTRFDNRGDMLGRVRSRVHAVERVSFDLYRGETLAVVGESGCGKSTLGRSILKLVKPHSGSIFFEGHDITGYTARKMQPLRRDIQYIFQDPFASLDPRQPIGHSIAEPLVVHRLARSAAITERVAELLVKVGLKPEHASRYPHEFSGGQRQRICIARALAPRPKLIIADESLSALDVSVQAQIVNLLIDLQKELGLTYIFISHDLALVERMSHRVVVMFLGQVVEIASRRELFESPRHPYTKKLLSAVPVPDPQRKSAFTPLIEGEIPSPVRQIGDDPYMAKLAWLGGDHFVATHRIGNLQF